MDFFAQQDRARRKTLLLMGLYSLAVVFIAAFFNGILLIFLPPSRETMAYGTGAMLVVILGGSLWRYRQLRGGGASVAELLGAREIDGHATEAEARKLRNVTGEMALASGTPMPRLYVLEQERGINAFVAGYRPDEMVLVVTRGALDELDRHQLQAVVGHEFSHIFHGDTRINLYLMSLLAGITFLGATGMYIMEQAGRGALEQTEVSKDSRHGFHIFPYLLGALLAAVGYIGVFFARLIKSAIARQREFLADAAAVQYTRDTTLAAALAKIHEYQRGSWLSNRFAEEISHFCFASPIYRLTEPVGWLATHPPLLQRIDGVDSQRARELEAEVAAEAERQAAREPKSIRREAATAVPTIDPAMAALGVGTVGAVAAVQAIGNPSADHLAQARKIQRELPLLVFDAVHKADRVRLVIYALLLGSNRQTLQTGGKLIAQREGKPTALKANELRKKIQADLPRLRLPLLDLALPALKKIPAGERAGFLETTRGIIEADGQVNLFEYCLQLLLDKYLGSSAASTGGRIHRWDAAQAETGVLLALVATTSANDAGEAETLYQRHARALLGQHAPAFHPGQSMTALASALNTLNQLAPMLKKSLIQTCAECILADQIVTPEELELLRIIAESLDCPMPPLQVTAPIQARRET